MTDVRGNTGVSTVTRTPKDDAFMGLRLTRDGAVVSHDWITAAALEGRVFVANHGTITTPVTFGQGVILETEPDFELECPASTAMVIPLEIRVYMETFGTSAQFECMASCGTGGTQGSTSTAVTPANIRTDAPNTTLCTVAGSANSGTAVDHTTNRVEFWRDGKQFAITKTAESATVASHDPNLFIWRYTDSLVTPVLYSTSAASRLTVFAASQAGTGFITVTWAELPGAAIS